METKDKEKQRSMYYNVCLYKIMTLDKLCVSNLIQTTI